MEFESKWNELVGASGFAAWSPPQPPAQAETTDLLLAPRANEGVPFALSVAEGNQIPLLAVASCQVLFRSVSWCSDSDKFIYSRLSPGDHR
jgi:hypothetical protein